MKIVADPDVTKLAEFAQRNIPASRLENVASGLAKIAPILWGHHQAEEVETLRLLADPISACDRHIQSSSSG